MKPRCAYEMFAIIRLPDQSFISTLQRKQAADNLAAQWQEYAPEGVKYVVLPAYVMVPALERNFAVQPQFTAATNGTVPLPPARFKEKVKTPNGQVRQLVKHTGYIQEQIVKAARDNPLWTGPDIAAHVNCALPYVYIVLGRAGISMRKRRCDARAA